MKFAECAHELYPVGRAGRIRSFARKVVLDCLSVPMQGYRVLGGFRKSQLRIVHYHHVFDDEREGFDRQLSGFKDYFAVRPLGEAIRDLQGGRLKEPTLSITFDDGFKNNAVIAAEILEKQEIKACFYIVTDFISLHSGSLPQVLDFCRNRLCIGAPVENMSWDDIRMLREKGHEIGSHTVSHSPLSRCNADELQWEIFESKKNIEKELNQPIRHFSLPFGLKSHFSERIGSLTQQAGYETCAYAVRGPNLPQCSPYQLRRDALLATWSTREIMTHFFRTMRRTKGLGC